MMPSLEPFGDVYVLHLGDTENRFDGDWLKTVLDLVGEVANAPAPRALVTTATGKFWSLGSAEVDTFRPLRVRAEVDRSPGGGLLFSDVNAALIRTEEASVQQDPPRERGQDARRRLVEPSDHAMRNKHTSKVIELGDPRSQFVEAQPDATHSDRVTGDFRSRGGYALPTFAFNEIVIAMSDAVTEAPHAVDVSAGGELSRQGVSRWRLPKRDPETHRAVQ